MPKTDTAIRAPAKLADAAGTAAYVACLALPLALLHARAVAEMLIPAVDILFVLDCVRTRRTSWLRRPFAVAAGAWWVWLALCSVLGTGGWVLGLLAFRLPLFAIAAGEWVFAGADDAAIRRRHALWVVLALSAGWIALQCWEQYLTGSNLFGQPRWEDGALTGPFHKPRAGPEYILLLFPVLLPAVTALAAGRGARGRWQSMLLGVMAALTMVLIGQRMPTLLMLLGFAAAALLLPRLRLVAGCAILAGAALAAAAPWVAPLSYAKLVQETGPQIAHFAASDYGLIFVRALTVAQLHPWMGLGFDGFRRGCHEFWTMHGIDWLGVPTANLNGGASACNLHPHNYYLEALDNAGLPGLVLFCAMVLTALLALARGLGRDAGPLRAGLFVGALVALWPLASTSAFTSIPNAGWVFLVLGFGFACADAAGTSPVPLRLNHELPAGVAMSDETSTDHGFIRAWAEAREGRPALVEGQSSENGRQVLGFDFGTSGHDWREIAWDEFFDIFESDALALQFRDVPGQVSPAYKLVPRSTEPAK